MRTTVDGRGSERRVRILCRCVDGGGDRLVVRRERLGSLFWDSLQKYF